MEPVFLASASPRRRELLRTAGIPYIVKQGNVDESTDEHDPEKVVRLLSRRKCMAAAARCEEDGIYLGADTVVALPEEAGFRILGKPADETDAFSMLEALSGREHIVLTGVTMAEKRDGAVVRSRTEAVRTRVCVAAISRAQIESYIRTGEPMDKAGAYGIQGIFSRYITSISGSYASVVGLPVETVYTILSDWGASNDD